MMVIEPRQRSPLGAFYRTPLGALGQGVAEPVAVYLGAVTSAAFSTNTYGINRTSCADVTVVLTPTVDSGNVVLWFDIPGGLTLADVRALTIEGDTSGAILVMATTAPDFRCSIGGAWPADGSTHRHSDGLPTVMPGFPEFDYFDQAITVQPNQIDVDVWRVTVTWWQVGAATGFQAGETLTAS